jgi:hypothetical protein
MTSKLKLTKLDVNSKNSQAFPFVKTDGGRSKSKHPNETDDCTVRAMAIAADIPYDKAHAILSLAGRPENYGAHFKTIASKAIVNGYQFDYIPFPAVKNKLRMRQAEFVRTYPVGRFILHTAKHVMACVDGTIFDTGKSYDERCIYNAWQLIPVAETEISNVELEQKCQREIAVPIRELVERMVDSQLVTHKEAALLENAIEKANNAIVAGRQFSAR